MKQCEYYRSTRCYGTKEMDFVNCGGDETKCSIDPKKREEATQHEKNMDLIHEIVDEAMKNKDRYVYIYCGNSGISVNVYPLFEEDEDD